MNSYWRWFWAVLLLKLAFAALLPISSDEAYFLQFGKYGGVTFYDHPPLTGWIAGAIGGVFRFFGGESGVAPIFFYRLLPICVHLFFFVAFRKVAETFEDDRKKIDLAAMAFWLSPMHVLFFVFSTDTLLIFFSFLSAFFLNRARRTQAASGAFLAGLSWGMAFLSKYLAAPLALGLALGCFTKRGGLKGAVKLGLALLLGSLVIPLWHFLTITNHCLWPISFNFFNRTEISPRGALGVIELFGFFVFLVTPWLLIESLWGWRCFVRRFERVWFWLALTLCPITILAPLAIKETGLHWLLPFAPFAFFAALALPTSAWVRIQRGAAILSAPLVLFLFGFVLWPKQTLNQLPFYNDYLLGAHGDEVHSEILKHFQGQNFATLGYPTAALMEYHTEKHYSVFHDLDENGRNDDLWTDWAKLDGQDLGILSTYSFRDVEKSDFEQYFAEVVYVDLPLRRGVLYLAIGKVFQFPAYREDFLTKVNQRMYSVPKGLRPYVKRCQFKEKYDFSY